MQKIFYRAGAISYVIWGLLHLEAARQVYALGSTLEPGIVQGRVYQDAWNLVYFAVFAIVIAVALNWKNSRWGYWLCVFPFCRLYNFIRDDISENLSVLAGSDICGNLLWWYGGPDVPENLIFGYEGPTFRKNEISP